ncbi:MAG: threonine--tRNA ligase, partial [Clostridia bacterium]|nr:threonine--tRNA ligase [Clostridia bacterium]
KEDTLITIQIDMLLAKKFGMEYVDSNNQLVTPYIIHRTSMGCYERTLALLIEKYAGAFPLWLAPEQVRVLPIGDEHIEYAAKVRDRLAAAGLRVELDDSSNTIGYKIRATQMAKVPYMLVIGAKEVEEGTVAVRNRAAQTETKSVDQFLSDALLEIAEKRR